MIDQVREYANNNPGMFMVVLLGGVTCLVAIGMVTIWFFGKIKNDSEV